MSIYVHLSLTPDERDALTEAAAGEDLVFAGHTDSASDRAALLGAEVALGSCPADWLAGTTTLRWIQLASTGVDGYAALDWDSLGRRLICTNVSYGDPVAQTCLAGLLALCRGLDRLPLLQQQRDWQMPAVRRGMRLLAGDKVLILGRGAIGRRFAELLAPFGCAVTFFARETGDINTLGELDAALPHADVVCLLLPHTPDTDALLDERRIGLLKPSAVLINAGRGAAVDERALVDRLTRGDLGGAVLDVTRQEPLPPESPLWGCPKLVLTQHTAGASGLGASEVIRAFTENLRRFRANLPMTNVVDWTRGY